VDDRPKHIEKDVFSNENVLVVDGAECWNSDWNIAR
jgi:hypothetical protein